MIKTFPQIIEFFNLLWTWVWTWTWTWVTGKWCFCLDECSLHRLNTNTNTNTIQFNQLIIQIIFVVDSLTIAVLEIFFQ